MPPRPGAHLIGDAPHGMAPGLGDWSDPLPEHPYMAITRNYAGLGNAILMATAAAGSQGLRARWRACRGRVVGVLQAFTCAFVGPAC